MRRGEVRLAASHGDVAMERRNKGARQGGEAKSMRPWTGWAERTNDGAASNQHRRPKAQDPRAGAGAQRHGSSVALANVARERAAHAHEKDGAPSPGCAAKDILRRKGVRSNVCDAPPSRLCNSD
ncbi:uncharacterized protein TrAFT101_011705 [Trichoderma asperellum]|uniref:uncharacterized protein n=1 Tax=Trichoderma asperellum TaxID=101201 RepID=UPI00332978E6|nr:hypothetical protein TrAFT101_011705 [Trichoderma asperellum]